MSLQGGKSGTIQVLQGVPKCKSQMEVQKAQSTGINEEVNENQGGKSQN